MNHNSIYAKKEYMFIHVCSVTKLCPTLCNPLYRSPQALLSMGFSRQEYKSGVAMPSPPEGLPNTGIEPASPVSQMDSLLLSH